ncbi:MAG: hypothetical protein RLZZ469_384 [Bacteroidota bacterium]|jgi:uncharacterized membrane protein YhaH (DUF805 family)
MFNWYKKVVFENYANFNGRARRKEFWYYLLANYIFLIIAAIIDNAAGLQLANLPYGIFYMIIALGTFLPSLAVQVRRMHDVGRSGWYILIPIYNLVMFCTNGDQGENEYGADPKGFGEEINEIGQE